MIVVETLLALLTLWGHAAFWVAAYNRLHSVALHRGLVKLLDKSIQAVFVILPARWVWAAFRRDFSLLDPAATPGFLPLWAYAAGCWIIALGPGVHFLVRRSTANPREVLLSNDSQYHDVAAARSSAPLLHGVKTQLQGRLPGNQILQLEVNRKQLRLPDLPAALEGLKIVHLSDLHYTGRIGLPYFEYAIEQANQLDGDLVAVTGDIVDKAAYIAWIPQTLGRLQSRYGVYSVLGNHDQRIRDIPRLRRTLEECGVVMLGGRWRELNVRGSRVVVAGDELPWFGPAPDLSDCPPPEEALRVLLAHTPDRFPWAQQNGFALLLAGHNHGGQIRFPWLGPVVTPSRFGVKYASGVFRERATTMHVSRGVSGYHALRFNCPPELTQITLTRGE